MWKSPRLEMYDEIEADGSRQLELDTVEEVRCNALPSKKKSPRRLTTGPQALVGIMLGISNLLFHKKSAFSPNH